MRVGYYHLAFMAALGASSSASASTSNTSTTPEYTAYVPAALELMDRSPSPLVDGHVDLPFLVKTLGPRPLDVIREHTETMPGHMDLERMRKGRLGALFMVAWTPCPASHVGEVLPEDFLETGEGVRDTLEAIDIINEIVATSPNDFVLAVTSDDVRRAAKDGKIAALIGVEGGHQAGNSLSVVRLYAQLGVRYVTLSHTCHNVFASSAGSGTPLHPVHPGNGLTPFGVSLVSELNRLGVLADLSHTSPETMRDVIAVTRAPVIFSHSGARGVHDHPRNVPDDVLALLGTEEGKVDGLVMAVFYSKFVDPARPTVERVADHIEHIATVAGKKHVGLGSDFDGMATAVEGLEDASTYPNLIAELLRRGWTDTELFDLMGGNLLRVLDGADRVKAEMASEPASADVLEGRPDLPSTWGGPLGESLPVDVREYIAARKAAAEAEETKGHDEL